MREKRERDAWNGGRNIQLNKKDIVDIRKVISFKAIPPLLLTPRRHRHCQLFFFNTIDRGGHNHSLRYILMHSGRTNPHDDIIKSRIAYFMRSPGGSLNNSGVIIDITIY